MSYDKYKEAQKKKREELEKEKEYINNELEKLLEEEGIEKDDENYSARMIREDDHIKINLYEKFKEKKIDKHNK